MLIIHLQAMHPDMNAAKKPTISDKVDISAPAMEASFTIFIPSSKASPKIGGMTIRNENCANDSFLFPQISPVAIVEPERDNPGNTAQAWAKPMINASFILIFSFGRGLA